MSQPDSRRLAAVSDGTADDLVADARSLGFSHVTRRMIVDWTQHGLLAAPRFQKSSRVGSDRRLYPGDQRRLFCVLLHAVEGSGAGRTPKLKHLALAVIVLWARGMPSIPTEQVQRAWRTAADSTSRLPAYQAREIAQVMVDAAAHPSAPATARRAAVLVLTNCLRNGISDAEAMCSVLTSVTSPWPAPPGQRIERSLGLAPTGLPLGVTEVVADIQASGRVLDLLRAERVEAADLDAARRGYQALVQPVVPGVRPLVIGQTLSTSAGPWVFSWDDKAPALIVLELARVLGLGSRSGMLFTSGIYRHPPHRPGHAE
ncbi:hypothetical protein ACIPSJ_26965 [Streptomyces sp. NPDC090088]|uniref:hypothetical protein n=1 Tax=Streptomyces sp. NPDC090088 TaxID=3365944 RepID=UPI0037F26C5A